MKKIFVLALFLVTLCPQFVCAKNKKPALEEGKGYVGTLPDISARFQKAAPQEARPAFQYEDGFNDQDDIKPAPRDNPAFINIIMKKDKTSQYLNDLNSLILIVENLQTSVEDKDNVQRFNAQSYYLKTNVDYFREKYKDKAEGSYISFRKVMQLNTQVQSVSRLRLEKEVYSPYVTAENSGNLFTQNNIDTQLDYLLDEIKSTLVVLKEAK